MRASATFVLSAVTAVAAMIFTPANAAETLRVRLDWTPWGDQLPFHLAIKKGWYAKQGLDVQLEDGNGSVSTVQIAGHRTYLQALGARDLAREIVVGLDGPACRERGIALALHAWAGGREHGDIDAGAIHVRYAQLVKIVELRGQFRLRGVAHQSREGF